MGFKNDDYINVYNESSNPMYFEGALKTEGEYKLEPLQDDGEKIYTPISYATLLKLNRTNVIKKQFIRIEEENEEEILKTLKIDLDKERDSFTNEEIESMILYSNDDVIRKIVAIKDVSILKRFLATLIGLKSTNQYDISVKIENYIRARLEEIEKEGKLQTELDPTPTLNERPIELGVEESTEEIVKDKKSDSDTKKGRKTTK